MMILDLNENEIREIIKRDGRKVPFTDEKIVEAIRKSFQASGEYKTYTYYKTIAADVINELYLRDLLSPTVEQVQDIVEEILIRRNHPHVAKSYIIYRSQRSKIREMNSTLMRTYEDITFKDASESDMKRENANINGDSAMGAMLKYGSEGAKQFYKSHMIAPNHTKAHEDGDIHIHDLDFYALTTTCCQMDIIKLFKGGFSTGHGVLREPNSISSYSALACIAIQSNQNDQHGGQSIANFDYGLALGVQKTFTKQYRLSLANSLEVLLGEDLNDRIKDVQAKLLAEGLTLSLENYSGYCQAEAKLLGDISEDMLKKAQMFSVKNAVKATDKETFQAMEALIHNLNTMHSRAGAQTPFSSINYGTDISPEGRMVTKNILLALEAGLGGGETPIFPIHIFRVKEGINYNPGDPNYDLFKLACRVSAKRLFPNFSFQDAPFNLQYYKEGHPETEIAYMGCRTRVISNSVDPSNQQTFGRGNLHYTSINLPRLGIKANRNLDEFFTGLDDTIDICIDQLKGKYKILAKKKVRNYPFLMGEGVWINSDNLDPDDTIEEVIKHGTLSIGFIGLAETLVALTGSHHGQTEEARELGLRIIRHMRARVDQASKDNNLNFTLFATPAEGLSGRFVNIDKKVYGEIEGVTDREYYTNSFHIPVYFPISAFEKIQLEAPYHEITNAGHITYVEFDGNMSNNTEAFEKTIRFMKESGIGYGSINHPVDHDPVCGYNGIIDDTCPKCGRDESEVPFERIRRITGYLVGTLDRFNNAKLKEVSERVKHNL